MGRAAITVKILKDTNNITLHMRNLQIIYLEVRKLSGKREHEQVPVVGTSVDADKDFFTLRFGDELEKSSKFKIHIQYAGFISTDMRGFYRSSYKMENETRYCCAISVHKN